MEILKIHAQKIAKHGEIDYEAIVKLSDNFNGADLRNVCTEAGLFAIRYLPIDLIKKIFILKFKKKKLKYFTEVMLKDNKSISNLIVLLQNSFPIPYCMTNFFISFSELNENMLFKKIS